MFINKKICPVCGSNKIKVFHDFPASNRIPTSKAWFVKCEYCLHTRKGKTKRQAFKAFWKNALNAETFEMEARFGK